MSSLIVSTQPSNGGAEPITFTQDDAVGVHYPHCDALVVRAVVARNGLKRMLVDNGSSVNIIFGATYDQMEVKQALTPVTSPIYGFTGDSLIPRGKIGLAVEMGEVPLVSKNLMKFLVVDHRSAYHGVLGRPALTELWAVTSVHHLCMKFPTEHGVATVRGDQRSLRLCYTNSIRKAEPRNVNVILMEIDYPMAEASEEDVVMIEASKEDVVMTEASKEEVVLEVAVIPEKEQTVEQTIAMDELDPRMIDCKSQTALIEELENFPVGHPEQMRSLQVGKDLTPLEKEKLKSFLRNNLDVFAWKHEDMVGIEPKISCHHLKIDPKATPNRQKRRALNPERYEALKDEVKKLIDNHFIRESIYPKWVSNPVLVKKHNGKWRVCVDFSNLNQACPKDSFPLP